MKTPEELAESLAWDVIRGMDFDASEECVNLSVDALRSDGELQNIAESLRQVQSDALDAAVEIVRKALTCDAAATHGNTRCLPDYVRLGRHGPYCLFPLGEDIIEDIEALKPGEQQ